MSCLYFVQLTSEMFEADLEKALLLSKLEYEEHKKVFANFTPVLKLYKFLPSIQFQIKNTNGLVSAKFLINYLCTFLILKGIGVEKHWRFQVIISCCVTV